MKLVAGVIFLWWRGEWSDGKFCKREKKKRCRTTSALTATR